MKGFVKVEWKDVDLFSMAHDEDRWLTVVNTAMNLHVP